MQGCRCVAVFMPYLEAEHLMRHHTKWIVCRSSRALIIYLLIDRADIYNGRSFY